MLKATGISRHRGGQVVLDDITIQLDARDRVGIVGPNGVGKSTLLRILAGLEVPDAGNVEHRPPTLTVGYLPQEPDARPGETLRGYLARRTGVADAGRALDEHEARLAENADAVEAYTDALEHFLALGGGDFDARAAEVAADVGLLDPPASTRPGVTTARLRETGRLDQEIGTLSGGEAARALLAAILLSRHDVLLLDEPTNNLDFAGLDQLEHFLDGFAGAALVVSHDRAFLDRCVQRMVEIDEHTHRACEYAGGWSAYVEARALARDQQYQAHDRYVTERDRLKARQRTQADWSSKGIGKAKRSGETDKFIRHRAVATSEKLAGKRKITEKQLERLEVVDKPWEGWRLQLSLSPAARSGDVVVRLDGAVVDVGSFRLGPVDVEIGWQERVGIVGRNGAGKSTLVAALLGRLPLAEGRRWIGPGVTVGELDQQRGRYADDAPLGRAFQDEVGLPLSESRSLLAKFGLGAEHVNRAGATLSPGERTRAMLAEVTAKGVNCLVLDEPTNHLDLAAIEQLEQAVADFDGTLVVVSHDRRFLEALHLTRTVSLGPASGEA